VSGHSASASRSRPAGNSNRGAPGFGRTGSAAISHVRLTIAAAMIYKCDPARQAIYETIIEIPEVVLTKSDVTPEITSGMPLTADILGDKRTVMNCMITPIEKS
jgi:hypothetical protein